MNNKKLSSANPARALVVTHESGTSSVLAVCGSSEAVRRIQEFGVLATGAYFNMRHKRTMLLEVLPDPELPVHVIYCCARCEQPLSGNIRVYLCQDCLND